MNIILVILARITKLLSKHNQYSAIYIYTGVHTQLYSSCGLLPVLVVVLLAAYLMDWVGGKRKARPNDNLYMC